MEPADDWITIQAAARLTGYSQQYLRRLIRAQKIQARKFGPIWQVNRQDLAVYFQTAGDKKDRRWGPKTD